AHSYTYPLSLHDALPISWPTGGKARNEGARKKRVQVEAFLDLPGHGLRLAVAPERCGRRATSTFRCNAAAVGTWWLASIPSPFRSEEHTSELQSLAYLVC